MQGCIRRLPASPSQKVHVCLHCSQVSSPSLMYVLLRAQVMKVVFGQDLADESAGVAQQVFSVSVAIGGLAAFALVLALIEQVVLQVRGSSLLRDATPGNDSFNHQQVHVFQAHCLFYKPMKEKDACRDFAVGASSSSKKPCLTITSPPPLVSDAHCL